MPTSRPARSVRRSPVALAVPLVVPLVGSLLAGPAAAYEIPVGIEPEGTGVSPDVAIVDQTSFEVLDYLLVGPRVWNRALSPDGSRLFTTNGVSGDVSVIDLESDRVIDSIKVGRLPWGVVVRP